MSKRSKSIGVAAGILSIVLLFSGCANKDVPDPAKSTASAAPVASSAPVTESAAPSGEQPSDPSGSELTAGSFSFPQTLSLSRIPQLLNPSGFPPMPEFLPLMLTEDLLLPSAQSGYTEQLPSATATVYDRVTTYVFTDGHVESYYNGSNKMERYICPEDAKGAEYGWLFDESGALSGTFFRRGGEDGTYESAAFALDGKCVERRFYCRYNDQLLIGGAAYQGLLYELYLEAVQDGEHLIAHYDPDTLTLLGGSFETELLPSPVPFGADGPEESNGAQKDGGDAADSAGFRYSSPEPQAAYEALTALLVNAGLNPEFSEGNGVYSLAERDESGYWAYRFEVRADGTQSTLTFSRGESETAAALADLIEEATLCTLRDVRGKSELHAFLAKASSMVPDSTQDMGGIALTASLRQDGQTLMTVTVTYPPEED